MVKKICSSILLIVILMISTVSFACSDIKAGEYPSEEVTPLHNFNEQLPSETPTELHNFNDTYL